MGDGGETLGLDTARAVPLRFKLKTLQRTLQRSIVQEHLPKVNRPGIPLARGVPLKGHAAQVQRREKGVKAEGPICGAEDGKGDGWVAGGGFADEDGVKAEFGPPNEGAGLRREEVGLVLLVMALEVVIAIDLTYLPPSS